MSKNCGESSKSVGGSDIRSFFTPVSSDSKKTSNFGISSKDQETDAVTPQSVETYADLEDNKLHKDNNKLHKDTSNHGDNNELNEDSNKLNEDSNKLNEDSNK
eukprot:Lankesteria_metandrocarpae@DN6882_c0_g1_i1.p1